MPDVQPYNAVRGLIDTLEPSLVKVSSDGSAFWSRPGSLEVMVTSPGSSLWSPLPPSLLVSSPPPFSSQESLKRVPGPCERSASSRAWSPSPSTICGALSRLGAGRSLAAIRGSRCTKTGTSSRARRLRLGRRTRSTGSLMTGGCQSSAPTMCMRTTRRNRGPSPYTHSGWTVPASSTPGWRSSPASWSQYSHLQVTVQGLQPRTGLSPLLLSSSH